MGRVTNAPQQPVLGDVITPAPTHSVSRPHGVAGGSIGLVLGAVGWGMFNNDTRKIWLLPVTLAAATVVGAVLGHSVFNTHDEVPGLGKKDSDLEADRAKNKQHSKTMSGAFHGAAIGFALGAVMMLGVAMTDNASLAEEATALIAPIVLGSAYGAGYARWAPK